MSDLVEEVRDITFEVWLANHATNHDARWCRELYPWAVLSRAEYSTQYTGIPQTIVDDLVTNEVTIESKSPGREGRTEFDLSVKTQGASQRNDQYSWRYGVWDEGFRLVAAPDGHFITLFTKRKDPHQRIMSEFMRGKLTRGEARRSFPLAGLLFRSLVRELAEQSLGSLQDRVSFPALSVPHREQYRSHKQIKPALDSVCTPFLSRDRGLWIVLGHTEEHAHRVALRFEGLCDRLISVFVHPTFTKHYRCSSGQTRVMSIAEFADSSGLGLAREYAPQIRFLVNHLRAAEAGSGSIPEVGLNEIAKAAGPLSIETSELREASLALGLSPLNAGDVAYILSGANLLNAALNRKAGYYRGTQGLPKEAYAFKARLAAVIESAIRRPSDGVDVYLAADGITYVTVSGLQFSFHAIPRNDELGRYASSGKNVPQEWAGLRLQPVAPLVLRWGRARYASEG